MNTPRNVPLTQSRRSVSSRALALGLLFVAGCEASPTASPAETDVAVESSDTVEAPLEVSDGANLAEVMGPEVLEDVAPEEVAPGGVEDVVALETDGPEADALDSDAGPDSNDPADVAQGSACPDPVRYYGHVAHVADGSLRLAPARVPGPDELLGAAPANAQLAARVAQGGPELFVSRRAAEVCTLEAYKREGALHPVAWTLDEPAPLGACAAPQIAAGRGLWPAGASLIVVDLETGLPTSRLALVSAALTGAIPADPGGLVSGGGSHWLVGIADALVVVAWTESGLVSLGSFPLPDAGVPVWLAPVSGGLIALATRSEGDALASRLWLLKVSGSPLSVAPLGEPLDLPGPLTVAPVTLGCDPLAGGGSHWFCPGGLLITGGQGWVRAFEVPSGEIAWEQSLDVALTGLSASGDGRLAGGGSHWLPEPGWGLYALGPEGARRLAGGPEGACVSSPLIDGDGLVTAVAPGGIVRVASDLEGPASGWTRPLGSDLGGVSTGDCGDGVPRGLVRTPISERVGLLASPNAGSFTLVGGATTDGRPWFAWLDARGQVIDEVLPLSQGAVADGPLRAIIARSRHADVGFYERRDGQRQIVLGRWQRILGVPQTVSLPYTDVELVGLSHELQATMVALFEGTAGVRVERVDLVSGPVSQTTLPGVSQAQGLARGPASSHLAWGRGPTPWLIILSPDLGVSVALEWPGGEPLGASARADGTVLFVLNADGATRVHWLGADGAPLGRLDLPSEAASFAVVGDEAMLLDMLGEVRRVGPQLTAGAGLPPLALSALTSWDPTSTSVVATDRAFRLVAFQPQALALASLDVEGRSTCSEAGYCIGAAPCYSADPCLTASCDPSSGACLTAPLDSAQCSP